jgi:hypothetical protein
MTPFIATADDRDDHDWTGALERRLRRRCVEDRVWLTQASRANQACSVRQIGQRVRAKNTVQR